MRAKHTDNAAGLLQAHKHMDGKLIWKGGKHVIRSSSRRRSFLHSTLPYSLEDGKPSKFKIEVQNAEHCVRDSASEAVLAGASMLGSKLGNHSEDFRRRISRIAFWSVNITTGNPYQFQTYAALLLPVEEEQNVYERRWFERGPQGQCPPEG